jgi:WD40 repeat protein
MSYKSTFTYYVKVLTVCVLSCFSCSKKQIFREEILILNGADNTLETKRLSDLKTLKISNLEADSSFYAHRMNLSSSKTYLSVAFPQYDFSFGHEGLHNADKPGKIKVVSLKSGNRDFWINVPKANFNAVISPDEKEVWTAGYSHSGRIYVYDLSSGQLLKEISVESDPSQLIFCKAGEYVAVACGETSFVSFIDVITYKLVKDVKVDPYPSFVSEGYKDHIFVINQNQKSLNIIDIEKLKATEFIDFDFIPVYASYNAEMSEIWVTGKDSSKMYLYARDAKNKWNLKTAFNIGLPLHKFQFINNYAQLLGISLSENKVVIVDAKGQKVLLSESTGNKPNDFVIKK